MSSRWQHLVNTAFAIDEARDAGAKVDATALRAYVDNALEVFPSALDPVEDFEAYAVRRMLLALRHALEAAEQAQ